MYNFMLVFPVNDNRRNITGSPSLLENGTGVWGQEKYSDLGSGDRRTEKIVDSFSVWLFI